MIEYNEDIYKFYPYLIQGLVTIMANKIFALVGPYAAGKASIMKRLMDAGVNIIPSYSTSDPSMLNKDKHLINYLSKSAFAQNEWMVKVNYKGEQFGIKKTDMLNAVSKNKISVVVLDQNGVKQVQKLLNGHIETIYIMVDYVTLVDRMLHMGHKNSDMKYHLEYAESNSEFNYWKSANYIVKNTGELDVAFNQVMAILGLSVNAPRDVIAKLNQSNN